MVAVPFQFAMTEFLAEDNVCGQNLLQIVAVGNAIIAEILRLKDYIPEIFRCVIYLLWILWALASFSNIANNRVRYRFMHYFSLEKKSDQLKYAEIILDFSYFKISTVQDKKIEDDPVIIW